MNTLKDLSNQLTLLNKLVELLIILDKKPDLSDYNSSDFYFYEDNIDELCRVASKLNKIDRPFDGVYSVLNDIYYLYTEEFFINPAPKHHYLEKVLEKVLTKFGRSLI
jgi:hypothetical protein